MPTQEKSSKQKFQEKLQQQAEKLAQSIVQSPDSGTIETVYEAFDAIAIESWKNGRRCGYASCLHQSSQPA